MKKTFHFISLSALVFAGVGALAQPKPPAPECHSQQIENVKVEMCLMRGAAFQHDRYMLRANGDVIFMLTDDFAEKVNLEHTLAEGPALEYPLSRQEEKTVRITGGCIPETKDGAEVARVCNFQWGKHQIVKDQRFTFD